MDSFSSTDTCPAPPPRVCILGGGFGGLYTALALDRRCRNRRQPCQITLVEPRTHFIFTPLLYELITDELKPWEVTPTYASLLEGTTIQHVQDWAMDIDPTHRRVSLRYGSELAYDYLVVALGSRLRVFEIPGAAAHTFPFCHLEDVWRLEKRLAELETQPEMIQVTVMGGGPSGVEVACKLADRLGHRGRVTLLERRSMILRSHPPALQTAALKALQARRITVMTEITVDAIEADRILLRQTQPTWRPAHLVVWTIGTSPHPWPSQQSVAQNKRGQCQVQPTLQLTGFANIFVMGDMAEMPAPQHQPAPLTAQAAFQAAPVVASSLLALMQGRRPKPYCYHHLGNMMTLGIGDAVVCGNGLLLTGKLGAFVRRWAYWLRQPTGRHRWRVLKRQLSHLMS